MMAAASASTRKRRSTGLTSRTRTYDATVSGHAEAERYLAECGDRIRPLAEAAHGVLVDHGCESYVKTIYVGYDVDGEMVAALYAHSDHVEVALALAEDAEGNLLVDASHLTWRTLPVAAILRSEDDLDDFAGMVDEAVDRVRAETHDVKRDNDFFIRSKRERRQMG